MQRRIQNLMFVFIFFMWGCASYRAPVNKTLTKKNTPSEELAKAYLKQMKKEEKLKKDPEKMIRSMERKRDKIRARMEFKKSLKRFDYRVMKKRIQKQIIYSSYH